MSRLSFAVLGARAEAYAAVPTLVLRLRIAEESGERVHALALRCQIQIEPRRRRYSRRETEGLLDLFGTPARWGDTLKALLWTHVSLLVPGFEGTTEVDVPVTCTYDFEVAAAKYLHALREDAVPLSLLFSGTLFRPGDSGFTVEQVPWDKEAPFDLPVATWREVMDRFFPGSAWIRLRRDSFDALARFKSERALPTWEAALTELLEEAATRRKPA